MCPNFIKQQIQQSNVLVSFNSNIILSYVTKSTKSVVEYFKATTITTTTNIGRRFVIWDDDTSLEERNRLVEVVERNFS